LATVSLVYGYRSSGRKRLERTQWCPCIICGTNFSLRSLQPYSANGFCSEDCAAKARNNNSSNGESRQDVRSNINTSSETAPVITITCPKQHSFTVMASFAGCVRPCPKCGEKCQVPSTNFDNKQS